jgi:hypothetical protein
LLQERVNTASENAAPQAAIEKGVAFLKKNQLPHGEFRTLASPRRDLEGARYDQSVFPTTMIAYSIHFLDSPPAKQVLNKALKFLLREMHAPGFWSYWGVSSPRQLPIDSDTTSNAQVVLRLNGVTVPANRGRLLANRDEHGRFYTWMLDESLKSYGGDFVPVDNYRNANPVINANALAFLGHSAATDAATRWVLSWFAPENRDLHCLWYLDRLCLYYAVSRAFHCGVIPFLEARDHIVESIGYRMNSGEKWNALQQAQAACTLLNLRVEVVQLQHLIRELIAGQGRSGSWPASAMYDGAGCFYGSEEMTTALCLEALSRSYAASFVAPQRQH